MATHVIVRREEERLTVRLNRPDRHNAFDEALIRELTEAFRAVPETGGVRVVVLEGAGPSFCAGADLEWMRRVAAYDEEENREDARRLSEMFQAIAECPRPVVARVHGAVLGGGTGLVAAADIAIAASDAVFGFTEIRLGLLPAVISPFVLSRIGPGAAQRYFLTGERFGAEEAARIGLVQIVVESGALDGALGSLLRELRAGAPGAQAEAKRLLREVPLADPATLPERTADWIARLRAGDEGREGVRAFLERRPPSWRAEGG